MLGQSRKILGLIQQKTASGNMPSQLEHICRPFSAKSRIVLLQVRRGGTRSPKQPEEVDPDAKALKRPWRVVIGSSYQDIRSWPGLFIPIDRVEVMTPHLDSCPIDPDLKMIGSSLYPTGLKPELSSESAMHQSAEQEML